MISDSYKSAWILVPLLLLLGCQNSSELKSIRNFNQDVQFLSQYQPMIVLKSEDQMTQVAICPNYQGRVMTSTATGETGLSFGWINYELISSRKIKDHINAFGGEDRFWLGPEGFGPYLTRLRAAGSVP